MRMPPLHCTSCGRMGNTEDGIEVGGECVIEDCTGHIEADDRYTVFTLMASNDIIADIGDHLGDVTIYAAVHLHRNNEMEVLSVHTDYVEARTVVFNEDGYDEVDELFVYGDDGKWRFDQ